MTTEGWPTAETKAVWESDFSSRPIVSGFLKDRSIGSKRLASMPDRYTNTIRTVGGVKCRPTVINCYDGDLRTLDGWWEQWARFMFEESLRLRASDATAKTPAKMLRPRVTVPFSLMQGLVWFGPMWSTDRSTDLGRPIGPQILVGRSATERSAELDRLSDLPIFLWTDRSADLGPTI